VSDAAQGRGEGLVLGRPGVVHFAAPHDHRPSASYGFGPTVDALCGRTSGIVYNEDTLRNLWPEDRVCKFCERRTG
jgi:hypothetical protein